MLERKITGKAVGSKEKNHNIKGFRPETAPLIEFWPQY
jgi:hypothetical protein